MPPALQETEAHREILFGALGPSVLTAGSAASLSASPRSSRCGSASGCDDSVGYVCGLQPRDYISGAGCPGDLNHSGT